MTSLKKKSVTGFVWDFFGKISLQGVGFFVSILLARILVPEDFGILAIIMVFINLANVFQDFGFSTALVQRAEVTEEHYSSVFFMNLVMGCLMGTIVFFAAPFIADFFDKSVLINLIRVMSVCFIINAFGNVTRAHLRREMNFKLMSYTTIALAIISGIIAVLMAYNGYGVWSLVIQIIVSQLLSNLFLYFSCKLKFSAKFEIKAIKELWGFSSRIFGIGMLDCLFANLDSLLIGKLINSSTLGYYYRAKSFENFSFKYTGDVISNVLFSSLSSIQNEQEIYKNAVANIFHMLSFASFLICGLLFITSDELIVLLFSIKWEPSVPIFKIIIFGAFLSQIGILFYNVILSLGNVKLYSKLIFINYVLQFLNFINLWFFGLEIYLIITIIIKISILSLSINYTSKILDFKKKYIIIIFFDFVQYTIIILAISWLKKNIFLNNNLLIILLLSVFSYLIIFLVISKIRKNIGLSLIIKEITNLIYKLKRS